MTVCCMTRQKKAINEAVVQNNFPAPTVMSKVMVPEIIMPAKMESHDLATGSAKIKAAKAPVQAPVIGKGIPTKIAKPIKPYF